MEERGRLEFGGPFVGGRRALVSSVRRPLEKMDGGGSLRNPPPLGSMAVSRILSAGTARAFPVDGHLSCRGFLAKFATVLANCDYYPEVWPTCGGRAGTHPPVLSCTAWGLSCAWNHSPAGGLLPRLFTLTVGLSTPEGHKPPAVCFL